MAEQELLQVIRTIMREEVSQIIDQKLEQINQRFDSVDQRLDLIEESLDEVRTSTNILIGWTEKVSTAVHFPLPAIDD